MLNKILSKIPVSDQIKSDTLWNVASLGLFGFSGLIVSFIISKYYQPEILGVFNINFALIMILSQLAGGGIHYSVLHRISKYAGNGTQEKEIISNGLLAEFISAGFISLVLLLNVNLLEVLYDNPIDVESVYYIIPAIFFLAINKVILSFFNGRREMKTFALANVLRAFVLLVALGVLINISYNPKRIALIFSLSEITVCIVFSIKMIRYVNFRAINGRGIRDHFNHGLKSLAGTIFMDINTKVDIVMLGYFLNDYAVGIYTLPALIIEGYHQLPSVLRNVINPVLTKTFNEKGSIELQESLKKGIKLTYKVLIPAGVVVFVFYPAAIWLLNLDESFYSGLFPLLILTAGSMTAIGYLPLLTIFNQLGLPKTQSLFFSLVFLLNVLFNIILIPILHIEGAAVATSISFILAVILLKVFLESKVNVQV